MTARVQFILKRRLDFDPKKHNKVGLSTGLYNSAKFMDNMLNDSGIESRLDVAVDNNCIDRLVSEFKPTHCIIEAIWVVPQKFAVLTKLHPKIKWIIRIHSEMPFMAGEGMAMDWIGDYMGFPQLYLGVNAPRMMNELETYLRVAKGWNDEEIKRRVIYMPNYYPQDYVQKPFNKDKYWIDISCFGAVRPLKNHMVQALAALKFAKKVNKQLRFHINSGRIEMKGEPALNNLRGFFQHLHDAGHQLISHEWRPRDEFLKLCANMDIGMQCNFSETFNIVSADLISQGVPIVGSYEIPWSNDMFNARPAESDEIADKLLLTYQMPDVNVAVHQQSLTNYTEKTHKIWVKYFGEQ